MSERSKIMKLRRIVTQVICLTLAGILLLSCTSCGLSVSAAELSKDYHRKATETGEVTDEFKRKVADFSFALFQGIVTKDDSNDLISPLSAILCLAMLANGADNQTKTQMEAALGMDVERDRKSVV